MPQKKDYEPEDAPVDPFEEDEELEDISPDTVVPDGDYPAILTKWKTNGSKRNGIFPVSVIVEAVITEGKWKNKSLATFIQRFDKDGNATNFNWKFDEIFKAVSCGLTQRGDNPDPVWDYKPVEDKVLQKPVIITVAGYKNKDGVQQASINKVKAPDDAAILAANNF